MSASTHSRSRWVAWVRCSNKRARVPIATAGAQALRAREAVGKGGAAALEELDPRGGVEVAAERELHREGALVVGGAGRVVEQQLLEAGLADRGESVDLAGATARLRAAAGARRRRGRRRATRWPGSARRTWSSRGRRPRWRRHVRGAGGPGRATRTRCPRACRASRRRASSARSRGAVAPSAVRGWRDRACVLPCDRWCVRYIGAIYRREYTHARTGESAQRGTPVHCAGAPAHRLRAGSKSRPP